MTLDKFEFPNPVIERLVPERVTLASEFAFGRVFGTVKISGLPDAPVMRKVFLISDQNNDGRFGIHNPTLPVPAQAVLSDPVDGSFAFSGLNPSIKYHAIAYDHTGQYDPVVKMNLIPTVD